MLDPRISSPHARPPNARPSKSRRALRRPIPGRIWTSVGHGSVRCCGGSARLAEAGLLLGLKSYSPAHIVNRALTMSQLHPAVPVHVVVRAAALRKAEVDARWSRLSIDKGICYGFTRSVRGIWRELTVPGLGSRHLRQVAWEYQVEPAPASGRFLPCWKSCAPKVSSKSTSFLHER